MVMSVVMAQRGKTQDKQHFSTQSDVPAYLYIRDKADAFYVNY